MNNAKLFVIDYQLHGDHKSFIIRAETMDNAEAWHWASCDAGIGRIGRYGREKVKKSQQAFGRALRHYRCNLAPVQLSQLNDAHRC